MQLRQARGIAVDRFGQELQGDLLAELEVVGAIDLAHAALAEPADDAVAVVEQRARLEAPVVDGLVVESQLLLVVDLDDRGPLFRDGGVARRMPRDVRIILRRSRRDSNPCV